MIGSIEASLRRIAHFDYWSDKVRRSVLTESKADILLFGNAERALVDLTHRLAKGEADIPTIVRAIYIGLDPRLVGSAALSVLAHLEELVARGAVKTEGPPSISGTYRLA